MNRIITPTTIDKYNTVINKNTLYFFNQEFEEKHEGHINSIKQILLLLKNDIENDGLKEEIFDKLLKDKEHGLKALLALTGVSNETLKRLTTIMRIVDDPELNKLVNKDKWCKDKSGNSVSEWSDAYISKFIKENEFFRKAIVSLFFGGSAVPFLSRTLPLFESKKLNISKLKFEIPEMIDTLVRYREKGSYSGKKENNPEVLIERILNEKEIPFTRGDLDKLKANNANSKRSMDFIIPNQDNPLVIIECSFLATTSSGQGDKSKTEIQVASLIKKHYPQSKFIGFVDGIGWYVREGDLRRMVDAYDDVFTFHPDEQQRFKDYLNNTL